MKIYQLFPFLLLLTACMEHQKEPVSNTKPTTQHPCAGMKDTSFHQLFTLSPGYADLEELVKFIEARGELKQYRDKGQPLYSADTGIVLSRLLCEEDFYNSPVESWHLDSVVRISTTLKLVKPVPGAKGIFGTIRLTQCNFVSEAEKEKALALFKKGSWGNPILKWNEYRISVNKNRIYILEPSLAMMTDPLNRCLKAMEERWK